MRSTGLYNYVKVRLSRIAGPAGLFRAISLVWASTRGWTVAWVCLLALQGLVPVATVLLTRPLVDSALSALRSGGNFGPVLTYGILMAATLLLSEALSAASSWVRTAQSELVRNHISQIVQEKSAAVDLGFYETPEFFDRLHRARAEAATLPLSLTGNLGGLAQNAITLIAMAGILTRYGVWLPAALFASALPALFVVLHFASRQHAFIMRTTVDERRANYYDWVLTSREYAAELRLFQTARTFRDRFRNVRENLATQRIALARAQSTGEFSAGVAALAIGGLSLLWMGTRVMQGKASPGDLALFYQAFQQGSGLVRTLLGNAGQIYRNSLYLEGLFEFMDLQPAIVSPAGASRLESGSPWGIRFEDVAFRYPGSERLAVAGVSLEICPGETLAIVGENGAGKSTLVRLLCRFYDPASGNIRIDGRDLRDLAVEELRSQIAVLFQDPSHYYATVAANIDPSDSSARSAITEAAQAAGADSIAAHLPHGYDNMLGRWFAEGAELSGGEWQRIALARAFLRNAPILILDEPTSAMDPWAEADWLGRFETLTKGKTALLITHRFRTARIARHIAVMVDGKVVEYGTHEELMALGGRYAAGWTSQERA